MRTTRNKADTELVRQQNRSLVLEALRRHGPLASIELGSKTGLSPATISAITNDMLCERLIRMDEEETARTRRPQRGRPKVKLTLDANAALILGISISHNLIRFMLADYCGAVRARKAVNLETATLSADEFAALLTDCAKSFLSENAVEISHIAIASVTCQGSVDTKRGEIIWSPAFNARPVAVAAPLEEALGVQCLVANDTNAIAHLLHVEDASLGTSFAVLYLGSGIGLGLIVNNTLLEGTDGSASEFGHMVWARNGAICRCGRRGCIEAYAADFGIFRSAEGGLDGVPPAAIAPTKAEMHALAARARAGEPQALAAFSQAGAAIGDGLSNLVMLLNPQRILLAGPGTAHLDLLEKGLKQGLAHAAANDDSLALTVLDDPRDLEEAGLFALAYTRLDRENFAKRVSVEEVAARRENSMAPSIV